jgi:hypothetical protein
MKVEHQNLLVFPVTPETDLGALEILLGPGTQLVLASSVTQQIELGDGAPRSGDGRADDRRALAVHHLPSIHEPDFEARFLELVERFHVSRLHSPVASVFAHLKKFIAGKGLPLTIVGGSPQEKAVAAHRALASRARRLFAHSLSLSEAVEPQQLGRFHALLLLTRQIYGETNQEKLSAMFAAMASTVPGDVVEIGALAGRSAVALGYLANLFGVGPVLAIDPWSPASAIQHDSPALIQELPDAWNLEDVFALFLSNLSVLPVGTANYLRCTSVQAAERYRAGLSIETPEFGRIDYAGEIALLHIDGNHDLDAVLADCRLWVPRIKSGGWLILDDYVWAHGGGPHAVGDAIIERYSGAIAQSFVCGKALFIKWSARPPLERAGLLAGWIPPAALARR